MQKVMLVGLVFAGVAAYTTLAVSAEDLAAAVKERRHLMKDIVGPAAKLGGQMVKGVKPFDAEAAAKAMNDINGVPDKYVKLFPKGTEHGAIADSEAKPAIWEDFPKFETRPTSSRMRAPRRPQPLPKATRPSQPPSRI